MGKLNGAVVHKSKTIPNTLAPTWKKETFTLARYNKKLHGMIAVELWDANLLLPPSFMGQITIDPDTWKGQSGAVWTKLTGRGIADEEVGGELLVEVKTAPAPQIVYESPLWVKSALIVKANKSVYAVLYAPSELVLYQDVTCSKELKRFVLKEGKATVCSAKGGGMAIAGAPPAGKITLIGRDCCTAEWRRVLGSFWVSSSSSGKGGGCPSPTTAALAEAAPPAGRFFGRSLEDMARDGTLGSDGATVPAFLTELMGAVERWGLDFEGVFRLSATKMDIDDGVLRIENGESLINGGNEDSCCMLTVTGLIKLFFRKLPQPLFTFELYQSFVDAMAAPGGIEEEKAQLMALVGRLPKANKAIAAALFSLLAKVAAHSETNLMTPSNIAIVFAPVLLWPKSQDALFTLTNLNAAQAVVEALIVEGPSAFAPAAPAAAAPIIRRLPLERKVTMMSHVACNEKKARPAMPTEDAIRELESDPEKFEEKARVLFEGYDDDGNKFLDIDEFTLFFIDLIRVYSISYITRDDVTEIMDRISEGDMKITFAQFFAWWKDFNDSLKRL